MCVWEQKIDRIAEAFSQHYFSQRPLDGDGPSRGGYHSWDTVTHARAHAHARTHARTHAHNTSTHAHAHALRAAIALLAASERGHHSRDAVIHMRARARAHAPFTSVP